MSQCEHPTAVVTVNHAATYKKEQRGRLVFLFPLRHVKGLTKPDFFFIGSQSLMFLGTLETRG